ncbi:MAG: hypothetical protein R3B13_16545 [Polyangiaceae bacterium]
MNCRSEPQFSRIGSFAENSASLGRLATWLDGYPIDYDNPSARALAKSIAHGQWSYVYDTRDHWIRLAELGWIHEAEP